MRVTSICLGRPACIVAVGVAAAAVVLATASPSRAIELAYPTVSHHASAVSHVSRRAARSGFTPARHLAPRPLSARPDFATSSTATAESATTAQASAVLTPDDPAWPQEWGLSLVGAPAAWELAEPVHQVIVAVIDSGVDPSQPDLQGALVPGADFADGTGDTSDQFGHGTMVAGVIAARGNNGTGVAGACWTCLIMPIKVLDANGIGTAVAVAQGIVWAADHGANIINMSFVLSEPDEGVAAAIAYAHERGVLVIAAAGNGGNTDPTYPAAYPYVVSVAATDDTDHLYSWSSYGSWVTLAAPGCAMTTAMGASYVSFCGTSASAPLAAGLAGLALSSGTGSEADIEATLEQTAVPLPGSVGSGRVDALRLLQTFG